jgi:hypothetical protein
VFNALSVFLIMKFRSPVAIVAFDTNPLIIYLSPDGKGHLIGGIVLVSAAGPMTGFTLHAPKLRCNLLAYESLGFAIARCVALQTVGIVLHPSQTGKGICMRVFFPFLEVFKMTEAAFPVPNIVGGIFGEDRGSAGKERAHIEPKRDQRKKQGGNQNHATH